MLVSSVLPSFTNKNRTPEFAAANSRNESTDKRDASL
jgi:hypothetical protein